MKKIILISTFAVLLTTLLLAKGSHLITPNKNPQIADSEKSEDELSQYQIPPDVLKVLNQAKATGNPVLGIRADGPTYHIPILMYHYVEYVSDPGDKIRISLNTIPEVFEKQIATLAEAKYDFITASDLADILDGIKPIPPKPVMLTFDDGYEDFYTNAFPILKKYNAKSVQYVISGFLNHPNHMTDEQLQEIASSGIVEIGSHTVNHLALAGLDSEKAGEEISKSRIELEKQLNIPITALAYPYGSYNIESIQQAKKAGYRTSVSTVPGSSVNNSVRFLAFRLRPGFATGPELLALLSKNESPETEKTR